jgi:hypothetical protein
MNASRRAPEDRGSIPARICRPRSVRSTRRPRPPTTPKSRALASLVRYVPLLVPLYPRATASRSGAIVPPALATIRATATAASRS